MDPPADHENNGSSGRDSEVETSSENDTDGSDIEAQNDEDGSDHSSSNASAVDEENNSASDEEQRGNVDTSDAQDSPSEDDNDEDSGADESHEYENDTPDSDGDDTVPAVDVDDASVEDDGQKNKSVSTGHPATRDSIIVKETKESLKAPLRNATNETISTGDKEDGHVEDVDDDSETEEHRDEEDSDYDDDEDEEDSDYEEEDDEEDSDYDDDEDGEEDDEEYGEQENSDQEGSDNDDESHEPLSIEKRVQIDPNLPHRTGSGTPRVVSTRAGDASVSTIGHEVQPRFLWCCCCRLIPDKLAQFTTYVLWLKMDEEEFARPRQHPLESKQAHRSVQETTSLT